MVPFSRIFCRHRFRGHQGLLVDIRGEHSVAYCHANDTSSKQVHAQLRALCMDLCKGSTERVLKFPNFWQHSKFWCGRWPSLDTRQQSEMPRCPRNRLSIKLRFPLKVSILRIFCYFVSQRSNDECGDWLQLAQDAFGHLHPSQCWRQSA